MIASKHAYAAQPITKSDLGILATHVLSTHLSQPPYQLIFPGWAFNTSTLLSFYTQSLALDLDNESAELLKVLDPSTQEIVATMVLIRRTISPSDGISQGSGDVPEIANGEVWKKWKMAILEAETPMVGIEHLALVHLSTIPSHRQQGIANILLDLAKHRSHQASLPLFICSPPTTSHFFSKCGFVTNAVVNVDLTGWVPSQGIGLGNYALSSMLQATGFS